MRFPLQLPSFRTVGAVVIAIKRVRRAGEEENEREKNGEGHRDVQSEDEKGEGRERKGRK